MNPYEGGRVALYGVWGDRGDVLSTIETARYWAELAGHPATPLIEAQPNSSREDDCIVERHIWAGPGRVVFSSFRC